MSELKGKRIIAGITGGIAAYKAAGIVSKLCQEGAEVFCIMTKAAQEFVTPLTLQTLSKNKVLTDLFQDDPLRHVELAYKADLFVIMPATYNIIGKVASGIADDFLTTTIAATKAPVLFCPAMESNMYQNPIFQENKRKLEALGYRFLEPEIGHLASGREGLGRFPPEERVLEAIKEILREGSLLTGRKILITAGPTREMIDPIRCITNKSSGKMGYALAEKAQALGASAVCLISGPTQIPAPSGVEFIRVESTEEMRAEVLKRAKFYDLIIMAAAVADWRPKRAFTNKLAKAEQDELNLVLERTPDILKELGEKKRKGQILIGFAAETKDLIKNAKKKLTEKNLELIVANDVTQEGAGPEVDTNIVTLIYKDGKTEELPKMSKSELALEILGRIVKISPSLASK